MATITVRYLGLVKNTVGRQEDVVDVPEQSTVRGLLGVLTERHGDAFRVSVMTPDGNLRPASRVLLDGQDVEEIGGLDAILAGELRISIVVLVYPVVGG